MNIGIVDVDGHNFPNLALMKIASYFKSNGDDVDWWSPIHHYDVLFMSKVFSFTPDMPNPLNADITIRGGYGIRNRID